MHFARIGLIYNPNAGRPRERQASVQRFASLLTAAGRAVTVLPTGHPGHAAELARAAVDRGCDLVVANGGDGTINEVLQGVVGSGTALGIWPGGTANLLAKELAFPSRLPDVVDRVLAGRVRRVTVGRLNERYFLLMAGIGLDAAVARAVDPTLKRRIGKGAFVLSTLRTIWEWRLEPFLVELPGEQVLGRFVVAGNARTYAGGLKFTPRAHLEDPELDLCIFTSDSRLDYLSVAAAALFGSHREMPGVIYRKVARAHITSAARTEAPVQVDGEVVGRLPVSLVALPAALTLLV